MIAIAISLPDSLKTFVDAEVATKGYGNVSEYFRTLLREMSTDPANDHQGQRRTSVRSAQTGRI